MACQEERSRERIDGYNAVSGGAGAAGGNSVKGTSVASPYARQAWYETLQALRIKIDRNRERVMAKRWGQHADPEAERVAWLIERDDVL